MSKHFNVAVASDGIALVTMDSPGRSMNVLGPEVEAELADVLNRVVTDAAIKGVVVTSGKSSFLAGYDLTEFLRSFGPSLTAAEAYDRFGGGLQQLLRKIETCGKPWVAAINGLALGGGFELCLACHCRLMADDPKVFVGRTMVAEGIDPVLIERAGKLAGMLVGPLAVTDEVSLELQYKVENQTREDLGGRYKEKVSWPVLKHFVEDLKRLGRKTGGTLSFIDTLGPARFVAECKRLARLCGERFKPTKGLLARAQTGELYYDTAAKATAKAS